MKKVNRTIAIIVTSLALVSSIAVFADENKSYVGSITANEKVQDAEKSNITTIKNNITTGPAITVDVNTTTAAQISVIQTDEPTSLESKIEGIPNVGSTIEDKVIAYDSNGKQVALEQSKIKYEWFVNGKQVGEEKALTITTDMNGKGIYCKVIYDDNTKGGNK